MSDGEEENQSEQSPGTSDDDPSEGFDTRRDIGSLPAPESPPEPEPSEGFETTELLEGDASDGFPTNIEVRGLDRTEVLPSPSEGFKEKSEG
jgi:hypothetical protein